MELKKTQHGYELYPPDSHSKYEQIYCRDDQAALEDIRGILKDGRALTVHNLYETFYGCGWGRWLIEGTQDIATATITEHWHAWGNCPPYPSTIVLVPKANVS